MKSLLQTVLLVFSLALYAQQTYVPDDNFEQALIDLGYDDVLDDYVLTANIIAVVELDVSHKDIYDMTGIEDFQALEHLESKGNFHPILDISSNGNLVYLNCNNSQVQELYVNNEIVELHCESNQIVNIDISNCLDIQKLYIGSNLLTMLNVTGNTNLIELRFTDNLIEYIDLQYNTSLSLLACSYNNLTNLSITQNTLLSDLYCMSNSLNTIDTSNNPNLIQLAARDNNITSLDLSVNTSLLTLTCQNNSLTELDLTNNPISFLEVQNNQLEWIDIRNGYNDNMLNFNATNNPDLHCVFVDDTDFLYPNNWHVDDNSIFMESESECDLAIENKILNSTTIFPNPTKDILLFENIDDPISGVIKIYNFLGELVLAKDMINNKLDISSLGNGTYFLSIETKKGMINRKIIKY